VQNQLFPSNLPGIKLLQYNQAVAAKLTSPAVKS
jgi:hypothetical protein